MHRGDLDTTLDVWEYRPLKHKGQWRGHDRVIYLGPKSQAIVQQNLREMYRGVQGNPLEPVFKNRNLVAYTSATYAATISRATLRGSLPHWHPHQIRHSRATEVDRLLGRQAAAACIGDTIDAALVYTENNVTLARRVASELG
jgi:integrase